MRDCEWTALKIKKLGSRDTRKPQTVQIPVKRFFDPSDVDESFGKLTFVGRF